MEFNFNPEPSFIPPSPFIGSQGRAKFVDWEDALLLVIDSACDYGAVAILMLLPIHMHVCCTAARARARRQSAWESSKLDQTRK